MLRVHLSITTGESAVELRVRQIRTSTFKLGSIDLAHEQIQCGVEMMQSKCCSSITLKCEEYMRKVRPLTIEKARRQQAADEATDREQHAYQGLTGSMAWPAAQVMVHAAATVSLAQAKANKPTSQDMLELNKGQRFMKASADVGLTFDAIADRLGEVRIGIYWDASWATRPDGSSQGGYMIFLTTDEAIKDGYPMPLVVIDWASKKLPRVSRIALSSEAQSGATAIDAFEWVKTMSALILDPTRDPAAESTPQLAGQSPCITDCKALYDAARSSSCGRGIAEKRTAIEVMMMNERMQFISVVWKWTNTTQQLADGLTKLAVRQTFAEMMRRRWHALKFDPTFTAGKKLTQKQKKDIDAELADAAADDGDADNAYLADNGIIEDAHLVQDGKADISESHS